MLDVAIPSPRFPFDGIVPRKKRCWHYRIFGFKSQCWRTLEYPHLCKELSSPRKGPRGFCGIPKVLRPCLLRKRLRLCRGDVRDRRRQALPQALRTWILSSTQTRHSPWRRGILPVGRLRFGWLSATLCATSIQMIVFDQRNRSSSVTTLCTLPEYLLRFTPKDVIMTTRTPFRVRV